MENIYIFLEKFIIYKKWKNKIRKIKNEFNKKYYINQLKW